MLDRTITTDCGPKPWLCKSAYLDLDVLGHRDDHRVAVPQVERQLGAGCLRQHTCCMATVLQAGIIIEQTL